MDENSLCLHVQFEEQAKRTPDQIAVVSHSGQEMTYKDLKEATDTLAENLKHKGCTKDSVIGIYMERSIEFVIAYVSILKAGGGYLPIELSYPKPLLQSVIDDSTPVAIITTPEHKEWLETDAPVIVIKEGWKEKLTDENKSYDKDISFVQSHLNDLAYVVYSSGTTGKPKGIMCPHRGAVFSYAWRHKHYPYEENERIACNVFFTWELMRPLLKGATLYVIPDSVIYDPVLLLKFLKENKITRVLFTPSLLETLLDTKDANITECLETMKVVVLCGEVVTMALRDRFVKLLPNVKLINLYSISECHDVAVSDLSAGELEKYSSMKDGKRRKFCPVGKVFDGVKVIIFDEHMRQMPIGMPGEIYVGGPTLARGYLKRPDLTAARFIITPEELSADAGSTLYRTGDWGYMLSSGELEICGRCDSMVKIRGYSIELQAVEAALMDLPLVNACTVLAHGEEGTDKYLVAYIVPNGQASKKDIRAALKARLPFHMIPSYFVLLTSVPISAAGKLDKKVLPAFDRIKEQEESDETAPATETERRISEIWKKVLQLKSLDIQENFFDLGGHSLLAARMLSHVKEEMSVEITMSQLFKHNTVADFSGLVDQYSGKGDSNRTIVEDKLNLADEVENHDQSFINMDIMLRAFWRSCQYEHRWENGRVLLTGATGYLGAFILKDLLENTRVHIYCLVRDLPDAPVENRLINNLQKYGILSSSPEKQSDEQKRLAQLFQKRVTAVKADVSLINFGLSEEDYAHFAVEIDFVIHAAAAVNLIYPYKALHGPNVLGTQNILMFACTSKIKPVHYISTNAVFPSKLKDCAEEEDMTKFHQDLADGYSQTKWVAEQLISRAGRRGLPVAIYRLGNLSGESKNAYWNPADFNFLMLVGCLAVGKAPNVDWLIEMTPVDFVSKAIVKLTQKISWSLGKVFHIINANPIDSKLLLEWISTHGYPLKILPFEEWKQSVKSYNVKNKASSVGLLSQIIDSMTENEKFFANLSTYKNERFIKVLETLEMTYPTTTLTTMRHYMRCLAERNVIPLPKKQQIEPKRLTGKVAIVTGASSGIGAAIARKLADLGASVAMAARRLDRLEEVRNEIVQDGNVAIAVKADVVNSKHMLDVVAQTEQTLGPVDIVVCCAGVMYYTMMKNFHVEEWERTVDVNCKGILNTVAAVLPGMLQRESGHVVNISSDAGRKVFPGLSVYSASKFFVEAFSQGLRLETADSGIKVTTIQPGDVRTELIHHTTDAEAKSEYDMSDKTPKILEPEDIANAVVFAITQPEYCAINEILVEPRQAPT
ncbi:uncharacterized protein LOC135686369 [Rhopilema esculentum]|uniref:uncharacterized protein LOC135686369 n=1 Tax=Rhopilema esculentum TaxID=499914 RepID=UPI0031D83D51